MTNEPTADPTGEHVSFSPRVMTAKIIKSMARILATVAVIVMIAWMIVAQPTFRGNSQSVSSVDPGRLMGHVTMLCEDLHPRDWQTLTNLDACADYIAGHFEKAGARVETQEIEVRKKGYRNIIGNFGDAKSDTVVIGAHYDACGDSPGADDNASGIAVLIELAYLLGKNPPERNVELVAYTLEEPPFFGGTHMGSAFHARRIAARKQAVTGMIALEMVGYYKDEWGSQSYPALLLHMLYPSKGNFLGIIGRWDQGDWLKKVKVGMKGTTDLPVYSIRAPSVVPGIDFSDHRNYWLHDIPAVMVTDTAFYRNKAYHTSDDTPDRLDYDRMSQVVVAIREAIDTL